MEACKKATGASRVIWMGHLRRTKEQGYARLAHTDFGPDFEPLFRQMLVHRCQVPEVDQIEM